MNIDRDVAWRAVQHVQGRARVRLMTKEQVDETVTMYQAAAWSLVKVDVPVRGLVVTGTGGLVQGMPEYETTTLRVSVEGAIPIRGRLGHPKMGITATGHIMRYRRSPNADRKTMCDRMHALGWRATGGIWYPMAAGMDAIASAREEVENHSPDFFFALHGHPYPAANIDHDHPAPPTEREHCATVHNLR